MKVVFSRARPLCLTGIFFIGALGLRQHVGAGQPLAGDNPARRGNRGGGEQFTSFHTEVPPHRLDIILGRPTRNSMTLSVLAYQDCEASLDYNAESGRSKRQNFLLKKDEPREVLLDDLKPATRYNYRLQTRIDAKSPWQNEPQRSFQTPRAVGDKFVFTIQADSHLDNNTNPALYERTLQNEAADAPDFMVDLGDTFMSEKHMTREEAAKQYLAQRYYFGLVSPSAPLFLVLGNHDGEGMRWDTGPDGLARWSNAMREKYFPTPDAPTGSLQNYYAWEWGNAQFIVLDPFWYTPNQRRFDDNWTKTLGAAQYNWLQQTLESSHAKFRFVFIHHLVGGLGKDARGGIEQAPHWEWGGKNADGSDGFAAHRPGWPLPIHDLLKKYGVSVVFHGHDHLFVKQELDGIVYQDVPQPGYPRYNNVNPAPDYGYMNGILQGSSGHLRVTVTADKTTVEYVRAYLPQDESTTRRNRSVSCTYSF